MSKGNFDIVLRILISNSLFKLLINEGSDKEADKFTYYHVRELSEREVSREVLC